MIRNESMRVWVRSVAWLCLSLMLWTVAAESTHSHPSQSDKATCAVCLAAHTASPAANSADAAPAFATLGLVHEEAIAANVRLEFSDLGIRGPPVL